MSDYIKPVVFKLGELEYGIDINLVNAIENYQNIVPIPNCAAHIKGIINLRGEVIPVYDLRKKFNLPPSSQAELKKLVVVKLPEIMVALEVDEVTHIQDLTPENIVNMPSIIVNEDTAYFKRVANSNGRLVILMDVNYLLTEAELSLAKKLKEDMV